MANNFNDNANKKNLNGNSISYTTYRTNYSNDEAMKNNGGVPSSGGNNKLYAFVNDEEHDAGLYLPTPVLPESKEDLVCIPMYNSYINLDIRELNEAFENLKLDPTDITEYTKVSDTEIIFGGGSYGGAWHFYRNTDYDVEININVWG